LQDNLVVEPVKEDRLTTKETFLIDISYLHPEPQLAARVVNTIGETFALSNLERKTQTTAGTGEFLQKRILELQAQIRNGEEQLMNYAKSNQILSLDENQNTVVERLVGLNKQLLEAENERKTAESAFRAALEPGAAEALASDANNKYVADADEKLIELRQRRAQLLVDNTEEWLEVKEVNQQIEAINQQVAETRKRMGAVVLKNLETRFHQAVDKEQKLRAAFDEQRGETLVQNGAAINYRILQQEINTNKSLLDGLLQRAKENDVILHGTPNNVSVIDYAIAPYKPVGPRRTLVIAIAFILSLILGIALALFLDYFDNSIHSIEDVETRLHLPVLGAIPASGATSRRRLRATNGSALRNGDKRLELLTHADGRSPIAEAYRQLRTSILLSTAGRAPKSMLITSSLPSEGKTTTAVNVALSLAQTGASVLIIDADMRRPRLHSIFKMDNTQGLSTCLSREMSEAEMSGIVEQHAESGVYMLTSGPVPPTPAELIGSDQMRRLFNSLSDSFQHIIIDSPPITSFTDGVLLSTLVDGVILVVNSGKSSDVIVGRSRQLLLDVGSKIFGVVLNNVSNKAENYYYHSYYAEEANDLAST
ncbi:MAG TPA: polysaccharide biosynthesis tyrosine autokinase, partial [Pyrinomonadaceae bacterium]|nr:polysaccharide biosynthesis tyrosine autokinase [Pyrinomonadaceae bacterium]